MAMEMDHSFTVPVPPERAWDVLLDVEKIAPCMPGATVDEFDGEVVTGRIKVKVGPVLGGGRPAAVEGGRQEAALRHDRHGLIRGSGALRRQPPTP